MLQEIDIPRDPDQEVIVNADQLRQFIATVYENKDMYRVEAEMAADRLIEADLRGIHSHGSRRVPGYIKAMDNGEIDPRTLCITMNETPAMAVLDAGKGMGHVAATNAMQMAISKAREVGTGTVCVMRSQHFGAASVYCLLAIQEGMIGFCTTSTGPATVTAFGSNQPATANNAMAWGVPTREGAPFVLDMACAVSSWGKVESKKMFGEPLPENWAVDEDGNPTTDPASAKSLLPAAGPRGFGLAFLCSVLAGPLVGRKMPIRKPQDPYIGASEHFFYAIDLRHFVEPDRFYDEIDATISEIRQLEPSAGFDKVRMPGELEWERANRWKEEGIPFHRDHVAQLEELAKSLKLDVPW